VVPMDTRDSDVQVIRAQGGWIHHWLAAIFIAGASLTQAVKVDQIYYDYKIFYKPGIIRSRLLKQDDDTETLNLHLQRKTPWVTATLDTYGDVHYVFVDAAHVYSHSHSFRIQLVENAGKTHERLDPAGNGSGFLGAGDAYGRLEETGAARPAVVHAVRQPISCSCVICRRKTAILPLCARVVAVAFKSSLRRRINH
jgi:hypothetical protein